VLTSFDPGIQEESAVRQMVRQHAKGMKDSGVGGWFLGSARGTVLGERPLQ